MDLSIDLELTGSPFQASSRCGSVIEPVPNPAHYATIICKRRILIPDSFSHVFLLSDCSGVTFLNQVSGLANAIEDVTIWDGTENVDFAQTRAATQA